MASIQSGSSFLTYILTAWLHTMGNPTMKCEMNQKHEMKCCLKLCLKLIVLMDTQDTRDRTKSIQRLKWFDFRGNKKKIRAAIYYNVWEWSLNSGIFYGKKMNESVFMSRIDLFSNCFCSPKDFSVRGSKSHFGWLIIHLIYNYTLCCR